MKTNAYAVLDTVIQYLCKSISGEGLLETSRQFVPLKLLKHVKRLTNFGEIPRGISTTHTVAHYPHSFELVESSIIYKCHKEQQSPNDCK